MPERVKERIGLILKNYHAASRLVKPLAARKFTYSVSFIGRYIAGRALSKV